MEGSGHRLFAVLPQHLPEGSGENLKNSHEVFRARIEPEAFRIRAKSLNV